MQTQTNSTSAEQATSLSRSIGAAFLLGILFLGMLFGIYRSLDTLMVQYFDRTTQATIHTHATPTLTILAKALSFLGSPRTVWPLTTALAITLWLRRPRRPAYLLAFTMAASGILESLIKLLARRPRSAYAWAYVHEHTYSFPSGHATLAVALYGILFWITLRTPHPRWQRATTFLAALTLIPAIGLSRIYLGAHYPTDVLAGYLTGAVTLALILAADLAL